MISTGPQTLPHSRQSAVDLSTPRWWKCVEDEVRWRGERECWMCGQPGAPSYMPMPANGFGSIRPLEEENTP